MKKQYQLFMDDKLVFEHSHFNACIGQAKYFYRHKNMKGVYRIEDVINRIGYSVNSEMLKRG